MNTLSIQLDDLAADDIIVTPNRRSARFWSLAIGKRAQDQGLTAWRMPVILPDAVWLANLWNEWALSSCTSTVPLPTLLSAEQEKALWRRVISDNSPPQIILGHSQSARGAMNAWYLAHRFTRQARIDPASVDASGSAESRAFSGWCTAMAAQLVDHDAITLAQLPTMLAAMLKKVQSPPALPSLRGRRVVTLPVVQAEPAFEALLTQLHQHGFHLAELSLGEDTSSIERSSFDDEHEQWQHAARWAREQRDDPNRNGDIVVVIPDLHRVKYLVQRVFKKEFAPYTQHDAFADPGVEFDLSLGIRLSDVPLVASALAWLRLSRRGIRLHDALAAVRARYVYPVKDFVHRSWIESGCEMVSLSRWRALFQSSAHCERFIEHWVSSEAERKSPSRWAEQALTALHALGFPGAVLDRESLQALAAFEGILHSFAMLDSMMDQISHTDFDRMMSQKCAEHDFQTEGQGAPIQVVGLYESLGLHCHALWVCSLDDTTLPANAELTPYLSYEWQRSVGAGRSTPAVMLQSAQSIWSQWIHSAKRLVVSHVKKVDGASRAISPLAAQIPESKRRIPCNQSKAPLAFEQIEDAIGVPWTASDLPRGLTTIQAQAQCPFQGYVVSRLAAKAWPDPVLGLNPLVRGSAVHTALHHLLSLAPTQTAWIEASEALRAQWISEAADTGIEVIRAAQNHRFLDPLDRVVEEAMVQSLHLLLGRWMAFDSLREGGYTVAELEAKKVLQLGGLTLSVRLDRIDRQHDDEHFVIDYKTGRIEGAMELRSLDGEPSLVPQLPAYVLAVMQKQCAPSSSLRVREVAGVAWAQVQPYSAKFIRVTPAQKELKRGSTDLTTTDWWRELQLHWEKSLTLTIEQVQSGQAQVAPLKSTYCTHCARQALCRVQADSAQVDDVEGGEIEGENNAS